MVYCATSPALAALETFVHLMPEQRVSGKMPKLLLLALEVSDDVVGRGDRRAELGSEPRLVGDLFLKQVVNVGMTVHCMVIAQDTNVLLNPLHPKFTESVKLSAAYDFEYDHRLIFAG